MFPVSLSMLVLASVASTVSSLRAPLPARISSYPCYVAFTAVVTDSITARIERVVTSGVRRLETARATGPTCVPADGEHLESIKRAVRDHLTRTSETRPVEFIEIQNVKPELVSDHLMRIARYAALDTNLSAAGSLPRVDTDSNDGLTGLEVIHLSYGGWRDPDLVPLPRLALNDSIRAHCTARNAALGRDSMVFHWAC
jgi:hypothetical protein